MIALAAVAFFLSGISILAVTGFAMTYVIEAKSRDERLTRLEQESALRAAVFGHVAVEKEFRGNLPTQKSTP